MRNMDHILKCPEVEVCITARILLTLGVVIMDAPTIMKASLYVIKYKVRYHF